MNFKNIMIIGIASLTLGACTRIQPGHVGIKVEQYGSNAGVQNTALPVGTYWSWFGTNIYEYPVFTNTYTFTRSSDEGKSSNEEFSFADKNGMIVTADIAVSYHVEQDKAPILFQKYRTDMDGIIAGPMRVALRNALTLEASTMSVEDIYGSRKAELIQKTQNDVQKFFSPYGIEIESVAWASPVRIPQSVTEQINMKIRNQNQALAAEAAVATAKAEAESRVAKAEGDAKAMQIEAAAIKTNPEIVMLRTVERWNGVLPQYMTGPVPFVKTIK